VNSVAKKQSILKGVKMKVWLISFIVALNIAVLILFGVNLSQGPSKAMVWAMFAYAAIVCGVFNWQMIREEMRRERQLRVNRRLGKLN
jgi:purine-cytosine permease-like protein